jgi:hypothetical protein
VNRIRLVEGRVQCWIVLDPGVSLRLRNLLCSVTVSSFAGRYGSPVCVK